MVGKGDRSGSVFSQSQRRLYQSRRQQRWVAYIEYREDGLGNGWIFRVKLHFIARSYRPTCRIATLDLSNSVQYNTHTLPKCHGGYIVNFLISIPRQTGMGSLQIASYICISDVTPSKQSGLTIVAPCMSTSTSHALPPLTSRFARQRSTNSFALSYALGVARARYLDVMAVPITRLWCLYVSFVGSVSKARGMILPKVERISDDRSNVPIGLRRIDSISSIEAMITILYVRCQHSPLPLNPPFTPAPPLPTPPRAGWRTHFMNHPTRT